MNVFCTNCGTRFAEDSRFCSTCGAPRTMQSANPARLEASAATNFMSEGHGNAGDSTPSTAVKPQSSLLRPIAVVVSVLVFLGLLGLSGCVYLAFRIKNASVQAVQSLAKTGEQALKVASGRAPDDQTVEGSSQEVRCPAAASASEGVQPAIIPLRPGLSIVDAWQVSYGDYELIESVDAVSADAVRVFLSDSQSHNEAYRSVCREDLRHARVYKTGFGDGDPEVFAGTTQFSVSTNVLTDLKTNGRTTFTYTQIVDEADEQAGRTASRRFVRDGVTFDEWSGELVRVGADDVLVPVIVNDQRVQLPAVEARGMLGRELTELWVVDDPLNPVTLRFAQPNSKFSLQVVKVSFASDEKPRIEQSLKKKEVVEVYGIHFDFGSDRIRPESEPVLKEIADALTANPDWNLRIEGHTDNIGGDQYNQALSERRAGAVKAALVERHSIQDSRLKTAGFGASRPKESNDTLEGRARNRRVELIRT
jgi:outer membrane protein OmpA-like peptidoglycan-associated protein